MNKFIKELKERIKKDRKLLFIICAGLAGIFLLFISEFMPSESKGKTEHVYDVTVLENRLSSDMEGLLKTVDGVGKVKVRVSIDSMEEKIAAKNFRNSSDDSGSETQEEYVIIEENNVDDGLTLKVIMPVIRGVAVSCEGGGSVLIRSEVTKLISAGYGIPTNKIWVSRMHS